MLLVLDNLETLLTPEGAWRDPRWGPLIAALTGHGGESRLILTSRIAPAGLGPEVADFAGARAVAGGGRRAGPRAAEPSRPAARRCRAGPRPDGRRGDADRERVRRVLRVVQGHPKLLELADAAAADRDRLDAQLAAAEQAAAGEQLEAFFRDGTSTLDPGQFLAALATWTTTTLTVLPEPARLMAEFLACLEDDDRQSGIIEATWAELWRRLDRPGDPPGPGPLLELLAAAALIQPTSPPRRAAPGPRQARGPAPVTYRMHPGVAAAIDAAAAAQVREAADAELADFWQAVAYQARAAGRRGGHRADRARGAGRRPLPAAPPRLGHRRHPARRHHPRDHSPGVIQAALPALRHIAAATQTPEDHAILARALSTVDPAEAEQLLRDALHAAAGGGNYRLASIIAGDLVNLLSDAGRLGEALDLAGQTAGYTRQAGLGPWTQLADQARRLQILGLMGEHEQVLAETVALRARMAELPARPAGNETVSPWNVREVILDTGRDSALALGRWQQCLDLNAEIIASKRQRGAGAARDHPHPVQRRLPADPAGAAGRGRAAAARVPAGLRRPRRHHHARQGPQHPRQPGRRARAPGRRGRVRADCAPAQLRPPRPPRHRHQPPQPRQLPGRGGRRSGRPAGAPARRRPHLPADRHDPLPRRHPACPGRRAAPGRRHRRGRCRRPWPR